MRLRTALMFLATIVIAVAWSIGLILFFDARR